MISTRLWWGALAATAALSVAGWMATADAQVSQAPLSPTPQVPAPQPAPVVPNPAPLPPASPDFQAGFCAGWNTLIQTEQQRYANWRALVFAGRTDDGAKAGVGQTADLLVNSVPFYVLSQPLPPQGSVALTDGRMINCPAAPPATGGAK